MLKRLKLLLVAAMICSWVMAQQSEIFYGQVVDSSSQEPIPFVHVIGSGVQTISDSQGFFSIRIAKGDTLTFSHINFEPYRMCITETTSQIITIRLKRKENLMQEIIVRDYSPEEELKQEMINHVVIYSMEEINAINNVEFSTILYKNGYVPEMNSLDNFKNYMKEPQGVTLFSSDPSKGLIKSIKRLSQQKKTYSPNTMNLNKTDTVKLKSLFPFVD